MTSCKSDVLLLTEIGKPNKQLIEEVFENSSLHFDPSKSENGPSKSESGAAPTKP